jgi:3-methyladenine DNA glycosylase AlkD
MKTARKVSAAARTAYDVGTVMQLLERAATKKTRDGMARFGISSHHAYGVAMKDIQAIARRVGRDHALALELWDTEVYEARMLTAFVDEPERVTATQMDRWCRDFDNWAICDTLCFKLWDQLPHAWKKVEQWTKATGEFQKRAGFVLLACLASHDKTATDAQFLEGLRLVEREAHDDRNFVKKGINWALRRIGTRNAKLRAAAIDTGTRLAESKEPAARWVGRDAVRELTKSSRKAQGRVIKRA